MNTRAIHKITICFLLGNVLSVAQAAPLKVSQLPLTIGASAVLPNIMLMIDNSGSMGSSNPIITLGSTFSPADMPTGTTNYLCNSAIATTGPSPYSILMVVTGTTTGTPKFCVKSRVNNCASTVSFSSSRCFDNSKSYIVSGLTSADTPFLGAQLNWYFSTGSFSAGSLQATTTAMKTTRMITALNAANKLVDSLTPTAGNKATVRLGLTTFNGDTGGTLLKPIADLDATQAVAVKKDIGTANLNDVCTGRICPDGYTPLAETLADIGRYFCTGNSIGLTLHPATNSTITSIPDVFNNHSIQNATGSSTLAPPIKYACQKSTVILVTDGLPNKDRAVSTHLRDYTGDCAKGLCNAATTTDAGLPFSNDPDGTSPKHPMNISPSGETILTTANCKESGITLANATAADTKDYLNNFACKNGTKAGRTYEKYGSDYLDDVSQSLFDMDLRPDLLPDEKNNLITYAVGIADPVLNNANSVLRDAALVSSGINGFLFADNEKQLVSALQKIVTDIKKGIASFSAIIANATQLGIDTAIFQAKYDTASWAGDFSALPLDSTSGDIQKSKWNAGALIPAWNSATQTSPRNIYTYPKGAGFKGLTASQICTTNLLTGTQKIALGITNCTSTTDEGLWRLDYLRGDISHEQIDFTHKSSYASDDPRLLNTTTARFRSRTRFDSNDKIITPDPWLLGDIVNSDAAYVSNENYHYDTLTGMSTEEKQAYQPDQAFADIRNKRTKMIYVGANDGMLHGFNASLTDADAGVEQLAYMPNSIFSGLKNLSSPDYIHQYFVDGSPRVGDVYFGGEWHTVLVGTTGAGGKSVFALNISNPSSFVATSPMLWEVSNTEAADMGYTLPQVSIGKMHDGSWAAIVANGYDSANNKAVLYIINIETGAITATIDTGVGSINQPNGLSTPLAADVDSDGVFDAIYAGDLLGNMWKFDVSSSQPSAWKIAYGTSNAPAPLFKTACSDASSVANCDASRQPITNKPQVGKVGATQATGVMVYFGTGKYFEDIDNDIVNTKTQSFYGVWDECALASTVKANAPTCTTIDKNSLIQQVIIAEIGANNINVRATSNNTVTYSTTIKGWYMDFINPNDFNNHGERIVSASLLRSGRIVFVTLIPVPPANIDPCTGSSTSWLMGLNALTGGRSDNPLLDITGSGTVNKEDVVLVTIDGREVGVPASGIKSEHGSSKTPAIVALPPSPPNTPSPCPAGFHPVRNILGSSEGADVSRGILGCEPDIVGSDAGRQSWRQL